MLEQYRAYSQQVDCLVPPGSKAVYSAYFFPQDRSSAATKAPLPASQQAASLTPATLPSSFLDGRVRLTLPGSILLGDPGPCRFHSHWVTNSRGEACYIRVCRTPKVGDPSTMVEGPSPYRQLHRDGAVKRGSLQGCWVNRSPTRVLLAPDNGQSA